MAIHYLHTHRGALRKLNSWSEDHYAILNTSLVRHHNFHQGQDPC